RGRGAGKAASCAAAPEVALEPLAIRLGHATDYNRCGHPQQRAGPAASTRRQRSERQTATGPAATAAFAALSEHSIRASRKRMLTNHPRAEGAGGEEPTTPPYTTRRRSASAASRS